MAAIIRTSDGRIIPIKHSIYIGTIYKSKNNKQSHIFNPYNTYNYCNGIDPKEWEADRLVLVTNGDVICSIPDEPTGMQITLKIARIMQDHHEPTIHINHQHDVYIEDLREIDKLVKQKYTCPIT